MVSLHAIEYSVDINDYDRGGFQLEIVPGRLNRSQQGTNVCWVILTLAYS